MPPPGRGDRQTLTRPPSAGTEATDVGVARELGPGTPHLRCKGPAPRGAFSRRRPTATPSAPSCVPGTGAAPASAPPAAGGGPGAAAGARSGLRSHPHPSAAPGVNGFALHPLGGALRVLGALTPARRRARSQWAPRGLWDETSGQGRRPTWVPPVRRPGAGRPLG